MPMTVPAEKATRSPEFRLVFAAAAVRQLARVAMDMPMKPERPEKNPPVMKAKGTKGEMKLEDRRRGRPAGRRG